MYRICQGQIPSEMVRPPLGKTRSLCFKANCISGVPTPRPLAAISGTQKDPAPGFPRGVLCSRSWWLRDVTFSRILVTIPQPPTIYNPPPSPPLEIRWGFYLYVKEKTQEVRGFRGGGRRTATGAGVSAAQEIGYVKQRIRILTTSPSPPFHVLGAWSLLFLPDSSPPHTHTHTPRTPWGAPDSEYLGRANTRVLSARKALQLGLLNTCGVI